MYQDEEQFQILKQVIDIHRGWIEKVKVFKRENRSKIGRVS